MSLKPSENAPLDPTAERVAEFVSEQIGPSPVAKSGERDFVRRLARFRQVRRTKRRVTVGLTVACALVVVGLAGSRFRDKVLTAAALSYRVNSQDPPSGGYVLGSQTAESLLAFSDGSKVRMAARTRGRVVDVNNRGAKFALDDGKVSVASARLDGMKDFIVIHVSHPFIMKDRETIEQTLHFLAHGVFVHGDPK